MLHVPTLSLIILLLTSLLGTLLFQSWLGARTHKILAWWAASYFLAAAGMPLLAMRGSIPDFLSIEVANALVILACAAAWAGTRSFEGRDTRLSWFAGPVIVWIFACQIPFVAASVPARIVIISIINASYILLGAYELWRGREERLRSRWIAILAMILYAAALLMRVPMLHFFDLPGVHALFQGSSWFGLVSLASLIYIVSTGCAVLAIVKERMKLNYRHMSRTDSLTELFTRRAFFDESEAALREIRDSDTFSALVAIDLDSFKQINDRFGHLVGDAVLVSFANVVRQHTGRQDIVGRLGGEEFAILLPRQDESAALMLAERLRGAFEDCTRTIGEGAVNATLSAGVCVKRNAILTELLLGADKALYNAKEAGRNRVRLASPIRFTPQPARAPAAATEAA